jgi:hypothetical protein
MAEMKLASSNEGASTASVQEHKQQIADFDRPEEVSPSGARGGQLRLNLVLPAKSAERLDNLRKLTEASSYTEVIRNALRLYDGIVMEYEKGNKVQIVDQSGRPLGVSIF